MEEYFTSCALVSRMESAVDSMGDYDDTPLFTRKSVARIETIKSVEKPRFLRMKKIEAKDKSPSAQEVQSGRTKMFLKILFATILEDVFIQLRILDELNNEFHILKVKADIESERRNKFGVEADRLSPDLELVRRSYVGDIKYKLDKWVADRKYITNVMVGTYAELALEGTFGTLTYANNEKIARKGHFQYLTEVINRNKLLARELSKQIRQQRNNFKSELYKLDRVITEIQSRLEDAPLVANIESRYIDNWQLARTEQHRQVIYENEIAPTKAIKEYRQKYDSEMRVHTEVELVINMLITETLDKIEEWMVKYDEDLEKIDLKIQIMKGDYQEQIEKRQAMERTLETHQKEMEEWIQFKEAREKARIYHEKMTNAAIAVQAWWRGLLVRLELGPYKQKKRPKTKNKK